MLFIQRSTFTRLASYPTHSDNPLQSPSKDLFSGGEIGNYTDIAIEAFSKGLLNVNYFENGWKQSVKRPEDIPPLMRKGFMLRNVEGRFYLTRGLMGGSPLEFSNTQVLANQLKIMDLEDTSYGPMQALALKVIDLFAQTPSKTKPLAEEVTALASANNTVITKSLLKALIKEINQGELDDIDLLTALRTTLIKSLIDALDPDDLIKVLQIAMQRITQIHQQDKTSYKLYAAVSTISDILDVMGDANVIKVGRINLHDPIYKILDRLSDDGNILIAAQAAYAKQALVRIPNDESELRSFFRHGGEAAQGFASLVKAVTDKDLSALVDSYEHFKNACDFQEEQKRWYGDVRILKLLVVKQHFDLFTKVMQTRINDTTNPLLVGNILVILHEVVQGSTHFDTKKWAMDTMAELFLDDERWGTNEKIKNSILSELKSCVALPDKSTSEAAKKVLRTIGTRSAAAAAETKSSTKQLHLRLIDEVLKDIDTISPKSVNYVETTSTILITEAQRSNFLTLDQKLGLLKVHLLKKQEGLNLATYIRVTGSRNLFNPKEQAVDLDKMIDNFLQGPSKVFLLLGDSGGGKSTYLRYLENRLWKEWTPEKPIPLFIKLPLLDLPFKAAIPETLAKLGFSDVEQGELKRRNSFLFLMDGYDEIKQMKNLYEGNQLNLWKGKTIITCRTQYLDRVQANYQNYFCPIDEEGIVDTSTLDEVSTTPFSPSQITEYGRKYIAENKFPRTWEQYEKDIASIPDLAEMIENPFLLQIVLRVLPDIMESHEQSKSQEQLKLLRFEIFDAFVAYWFNREHLRLIKNKNEGNLPANLQEQFARFAKKLAIDMVAEKRVDITPSFSKWPQYFSSETELVRSGVPLRNIGPDSYEFIHKSLLEYFAMRSIIPNAAQLKLQPPKAQPSQQTSSSSTLHTVAPVQSPSPSIDVADSPISFDNLNKTLLSNEDEIIRHLADCLTKDPSLEDLLFKFINRSKTDIQAQIAAANAITILNAAGVNLSDRDFSDIKIAGAKLPHAIITRSNLSHADLRNVILTEAILDNSTLAYSKTEGMEFSQKPYLDLKDYVSAIALSNDGHMLFIGGSYHHLSLWNYKTGQKRFDLGQYHISSVAFSPNNKFAVSGNSNGGSAILWNCQTGGKKFSFDHDRSRSVGFTPDSRYVLTTQDNGTAILYCCETGKPFRSFRNNNDKHGVTAVVSKDGKSIITAPRIQSLGDSSNMLHFWDIQSGTETRSLLTKSNFECFALSPNGNSFLIGSYNGILFLCDYNTGNELVSFTGHTRKVNCVAFSSNGKLALSGSDDKTVRLWDCQNGKELQCFIGHEKEVRTVIFSPDDEWALSGSEDGTVRTWHVKRTANQKLRDVPDNHTISFSADGMAALYYTNARYTISSKDKKERISDYHLLDLNTRKARFIFSGPHPSYSLKLSHDAKLALIRPEGSTNTLLWNCETGKPSYTLEGPSFTSKALFSQDGTKVLTEHNQDSLRLWNCKTGKLIHSLAKHSQDTITNVALSPDGNSVLFTDSGAVYLWDCRTGQKKISKKHGASYLAFSPDGKLAISGNWTETLFDYYSGIYVWDIQTGKERYFKGPNMAYVTPDGKHIIAFSTNRFDSIEKNSSIYIYNFETGEQIHHSKLVMYNPFLLPDGNRIIGNGRFGLEMWQVFDKEKKPKPLLQWMLGKTMLSAQNLNLHEVEGLSDANRALLLQHGALADTGSREQNCTVQ